MTREADKLVETRVVVLGANARPQITIVILNVNVVSVRAAAVVQGVFGKLTEERGLAFDPAHVNGWSFQN